MRTFIFRLIFLLVILTCQAAYSGTNAFGPRSTTLQQTEIPSEREAIQGLKIDMSWSRGGFNSVMLADFSIENRNDFDVKDIEITCTHSAKSGTVIGKSSKTIYEIFPARNFSSVNRFNMGFIHSQTESISCRCTGLKIMQ